MKKHGSNTENISQAVFRLGTKLWLLRALLTFLHATSRIEPQTLFPEPSVLTTKPLRQPLKFENMLGRHHYSSTTETDQGNNRHWHTREREVTVETVWKKRVGKEGKESKWKQRPFFEAEEIGEEAKDAKSRQRRWW